MHPHFLREQVALASVARAAGREHVVPRVTAAARQRDQVVAREALTVAQLDLVAAAELAAVVVAGEQEGVRHLTPKAAGGGPHLDPPGEPRPPGLQAVGRPPRAPRAPAAL